MKAPASAGISDSFCFPDCAPMSSTGIAITPSSLHEQSPSLELLILAQIGHPLPRGKTRSEFCPEAPNQRRGRRGVGTRVFLTSFHSIPWSTKPRSSNSMESWTFGEITARRDSGCFAAHLCRSDQLVVVASQPPSHQCPIRTTPNKIRAKFALGNHSRP